MIRDWQRDNREARQRRRYLPAQGALCLPGSCLYLPTGSARQRHRRPGSRPAPLYLWPSCRPSSLCRPALSPPPITPLLLGQPMDATFPCPCHLFPSQCVPTSPTPPTPPSLLQVGRAGRFGTKGLAITFVASPQDSEVLNQVQVCLSLWGALWACVVQGAFLWLTAMHVCVKWCAAARRQSQLACWGAHELGQWV